MTLNRNKYYPDSVRRVALMGADFATSNLGVRALSMGSLRCIYHAYPDVEAFFLNYDTEPRVDICIINDKRLFIRLINLRFSKKFYLLNNIAFLIAWSLVTAIFPLPIREWFRRQNRWLRDIMDQDLCFSIAGGDSFSDIYGVSRFFYVLLPQLLCLLLGKPLFQLPQTIGPFKRRWVAALAGYILRKSVVIYSRDNDGILLVKKLIGKSELPGQVRYSPDVAFVIEPRKPEYIPSSVFEHHTGTLIGVNVSGLLWTGGYNRNNTFGLKLLYAEFLHKIIDLFIAKNDICIALIPHVFGDGRESDATASRQLYQEFAPLPANRLICLSGSLDQNEVKYLIGKCDFFIGARMHACIAALSQAVPAVGIAYSKKFKGVFATLDAEGLIVDPRSATINEALTACEKIFNERESWHQHLSRRVPRVFERVLGMLSELNCIS